MNERRYAVWRYGVRLGLCLMVVGGHIPMFLTFTCGRTTCIHDVKQTLSMSRAYPITVINFPYHSSGVIASFLQGFICVRRSHHTKLSTPPRNFHRQPRELIHLQCSSYSSSSKTDTSSSIRMGEHLGEEGVSMVVMICCFFFSVVLG